MERKLAAILYADVAGYSRMVGDDEEGTHRALKSRLTTFVETIAANGGRLCHIAGDAVLAEFSSVTAALDTAVAVQRAFQEQDENTPEDHRLRFRIGVNLGEVIVDAEEVYGNGVNVAARLQELATPGGIAISGRAKEQVEGTSQFGFVARGHHRVKNIKTPVNVFEVVLEPCRAGDVPVRGKVGLPRTARAAALLTVLLLAAGALGFWYYERPASGLPGDDGRRVMQVARTRIAILPLRNVSDDPHQDYFAEAITEDLTNALGRFSEFAVLAKEAIGAYAQGSASPNDLRQALGVTYMIAGSVRRDGESLRLTIKLIDTQSGLQLWSARYDRPLGELLALQDEIVRTVAAETAVTLGQIERARVFGKAMPDLEAYDLFIRGRALVMRETRDDNIEARALFRQAIERDPRYALAYVGMGTTYYREATRGWSEFHNRNITAAEHLARQALQLDPNLAEAHKLLGMVSLLTGDYEKAERAMRHALELNPNSVDALVEMGTILAFSGNIAEAIQAFESAVSLGAMLNSRILAVFGMSYILTDAPKKAVTLLEMRGSGRKDHFYYATLAAAYIELGEQQSAKAAAEDARRAWPFFDATGFARQFHNPFHARRILSDLRAAGLS